MNNPKTRLLNPAKNEIGRVSKDLLDGINKNLRDILQLNQWKNTKNVIKWFKEIRAKVPMQIFSFRHQRILPLNQRIPTHKRAELRQTARKNQES